MGMLNFHAIDFAIAKFSGVAISLQKVFKFFEEGLIRLKEDNFGNLDNFGVIQYLVNFINSKSQIFQVFAIIR
jgi:hypothetical protein